MSDRVAFTIIAVTAVFAFYTYVGYPLILWLIAAIKPRRPIPQLESWPTVSITVPAYNEEAEIGAALDALLAIDYPPDKREIVVVSDASTDRTDAIVRTYADRGVRLIRMEVRTGKTAAENAIAESLTGEIIVNTDASIRIGKDSLKPLIAMFTDPTVGVASGSDISIARGTAQSNQGESGYVGYEMSIRNLETQVSGIIGASGCFYAIRAHLHRTKLADGLSRDFAAPLIARLNGYRSVSVPAAVCYVPRTLSVRREYKRKVRTMTRGMETLFALRSVLNPFRYPAFAWMIFSHKLCRWFLPWAGVLALVGMVSVATASPVMIAIVAFLVMLSLMGAAGFSMPETKRAPTYLSAPAFLIMGNVAALHSTIRAIKGKENAVWEPTRREGLHVPVP